MTSNAYFNPRERYQSFYVAPAVTTAITLYTCPSKWATVRALHIDTNGASNVTVSIYDGTTERYLLNAHAVGANSFETHNFGHPVMNEGDLFKVITSNADDCFFTLTVGEGYGEG